ncbi:MAG: ROK family protein [Candidatus Omnitrophica bacterium]|nr:ROK family protein [Candidatus Omnitrophota bacterium]
MPKKFIIAIDLGGTNLKVALIGRKYKILHKRVLSTKNFGRKDNLISAILEAINNIIRDKKISRAEILGVGLGLPGPIDIKKGIVHLFPNIPGWREVNLKRILEKKLKLAVFLDNDANLMALAEARRGRAQGLSNVICITLGTGVGGGLIIQGELYRGASFAAGEIGHLPINEEGPSCNCGGRACLEAYIGNKKIEERARVLFKRRISLEELSRLAKKKNKKAVQLWTETARHLGRALVGVVNLLNPDAIVIGGGVAGAGKILFDRIRKVILEEAMPVQARQVKIVKAALGNDAGLIGASLLVKEGVS